MANNTLKTLEERMTTLERDMTEVKESIETQNSRQPNPWLDQVYGAFKDDPLFDEAVKYGRKWRESQNALDKD